MKVAALVPYHTGYCSGQRFRIELWERHLSGRGIAFTLFPFASPALTSILYTQGASLRKTYRMLRDYADQFRRVLSAERPDVVFIYREAALLGPAFIERLTRRWGVPIVYDIDEPLFVPYESPRNRRLNGLRCIGKVDSLFRMSDHVLAVNRAIAEYAAQHSRRVSIVPMAVDLDRYSPSPGPGPEAPPRIGWVGTRTTQPNLSIVTGALARLGRSCGAVLRVVADDPMAMPGVDIDFVRWEYDREVPSLRECLVGIVPVPPSPWAPWKFFFKTIQMMSLGLPVVASPVGSNTEIIEDGVNGFLAGTEEEWHDRIRALIEDPELRRNVGLAARRTAVARFGLGHQIDFLEGVFRGAAHAAPTRT